MKVVPLNDKIVVKRLEAEEKTAGGIVLPDTAKEKPKQGKVLSLGDGKLLDNGKRAAFQVKEGDRVLFTSYAGNEVTLDGEDADTGEESFSIQFRPSDCDYPGWLLPAARLEELRLLNRRRGQALHGPGDLLADLG